MRRSVWHKLLIMALVGGLVLGVLGMSSAAEKKIKWKMTTTWAPSINLYYGEKELIKYIKDMTGGNFEIKYFPGGSLMKAFEVFDACSKGTIQMAGDWPSYWVSKDPAFDFLGSFPFGFTNMDYIIWMYQFGGLELMQEMFGKYGMTYFTLGATPMESGFRTTEKTGPIKKIGDYKGLKLRTPSRATIWILQQIGAAPVKMPGGEIYLAMQRGVLDGAEFSSPGIDWEMGFGEITKYWSVPCWFQPSSEIGVMVNLKAYNALPKEYQAVLKYACQAAALKATAFYEADSARAIEKFKKKGIKIVKLGKEDLKKLEELAGKYCIMKAKESPTYAKILKSQMLYLKEYKDWRDMTGDFGFGRQPAYVDKVLDALKKLK